MDEIIYKKHGYFWKVLTGPPSLHVWKEKNKTSLSFDDLERGLGVIKGARSCVLFKTIRTAAKRTLDKFITKRVTR